MIRVGRDKIQTETKIRKAIYNDCSYDADGWADASKFLPLEYDLVLMKIKDKKTQIGWVSFNQWDGLKFGKTDEVLYWKKKD